MKVSPIKTLNPTVKPKPKKFRDRIPRKVTIDNLPWVACGIGLMVPIPFTSVAFFAVGKIIQVFAKRFIHKP